MPTSYAQRQQKASDALEVREDFPGWPPGPRISNLPLRRMRRRSKINSDGCSLSRKHPIRTSAMTDGDSDAELDFLMFAEMDPCTSFVASQPTTITFAFEGRIVSHVPDFALIRRGRAEIHEVKGMRAAENPTTIARLAAAARHVGNWSDWTYLATSSHALTHDPRRAAVEAVWRRLRPFCDEGQVRGVLDVLSIGSRPIADVLSAFGSDPRAPGYEGILSMAAACRIWIDYDLPIGIHSIVRHPDPAGLPDSLIHSDLIGGPSWR